MSNCPQGRPLFKAFGLNFDTCRGLVILCVALLPSGRALAEEGSDDNSSGLVELHIKVPRPESYREYRPKWATRLGVTVEQFQPTNFQSPVDGSSFATDFGGSASIPLASANLGAQYSLGAATVFLDGIYGVGNGNAINGLQTTLNLKKFGLGVGLMLDGVWKKPWVIPFASFQQVEFGWNNAVNGVQQGGTTALTSVGLVGLSLPLSLLDPEAGEISSREYGLKETYLDFFGSYYATSNSSTDPDFQTGVNLGLGLRFIF